MNENLHSRLRTETREIHERLESCIAINKWMVERIDSTRMSYDELEMARERYRNVYIRYLFGAYGFERALEIAMDSTDVGQSMREALHLELESGPPSALILSDLQILLPELLESDLMVMTNPPLLNSVSRAVGAEYVRRGSRMGGAFLARVVHNNLGFDREVGARFLNLHGQELKQWFTGFCDSANAYGQNAANCEEVISAANDTFAAIFAWQHSLEGESDAVRRSTPHYLKRAWKLLVPDE